MILRFTEEDARLAWENWGCNCGPSALAACLGLTLDDVRPAVEKVGFAAKKYVSPTMMRGALDYLGANVEFRMPNRRYAGDPVDEKAFARSGLVRIQWTGPWTAPGANPKWAYRQTHWIASWQKQGTWGLWVFDVNGGLHTFESWRDNVVPHIIASIPRADGGWFVTDSWEVSR